MRERAARSSSIERGSLVIVVPTRGDPFRGLVVEVHRHTLFGVLYDVLAHGRVTKYEAERVSTAEQRPEVS